MSKKGRLSKIFSIDNEAEVKKMNRKKEKVKKVKKKVVSLQSQTMKEIKRDCSLEKVL
jgi:hypothetical protein